MRPAESTSNGESSVRLFPLGFSLFSMGLRHTIFEIFSGSCAVNRLFVISPAVWLYGFLFLCCSSPRGTILSKGSIRKYILLTLSHVECTAERRDLSVMLIIGRLTKAFMCKSVIVSRESHTSLGFHYHIGIWNENASKYTALSTLRGLFPEFEGHHLNVSFHKGWNTVCTYLLKEDKNPTIWGEESLELVKDRARSAEGKRQGPDLVKLLRSKSFWEEDDNLV